MEQHLRLKKADKKILLAPQMVGEYYTRTKIGRTCATALSTAVAHAAVEVFAAMLSLRHLVPLCFVVVLALTTAGGFIDARVWWLAAAVAGAYLVANLTASALIALRRRDPAYLLLMPLAFSALHVLYGIGAVVGVVRAVCSRRFWTHFTGETSIARRVA
jgi:hypothetical protein